MGLEQFGKLCQKSAVWIDSYSPDNKAFNDNLYKHNVSLDTWMERRYQNSGSDTLVVCSEAINNIQRGLNKFDSRYNAFFLISIEIYKDK